MSQDNIFNVALREISLIRMEVNRKDWLKNPSTQLVGNRELKYKTVGTFVVKGKKTTVTLSPGWQPLRMFQSGKLGYDGEHVDSIRREASELYNIYSGGLPALADREILACMCYFLEQSASGMQLSGESMLKLSTFARLHDILKPTSMTLEITLQDSPSIIVSWGNAEILAKKAIGKSFQVVLDNLPESGESKPSVRQSNILQVFENESKKTPRASSKRKVKPVVDVE